jgi:ABC-2 type transport system ATP-binding protein
MTTPAFSISNLHYKTPQQTLFEDVSLTIPAQQTSCILGENGAGKSTLLRLILNLAPVHSGDIQIYGKSHQFPAARSPIAFLPDRYAPPYFLTGRDYLDYSLKLYNTQLTSSASDMLEQLGLSQTVLANRVRQYSKGMVQKLCLASCLLSNKAIIVLDEPFSGLDPSARFQVKQLFKARVAQGATLLFTSHLLADVEEIADNTMILHHGEFCYVGPTQGCLEAYQASTLEQAYLKAIGFNG